MTPNSTALIRATVLTIWLVVVMTIGAELSAPFKTFLTGLVGHHWVAKGVIAAVAYLVFYFLFSRSNESDALRGVWYVVWSVVLGGLSIFAFYLWHFVQG